MYQCRHHCPLLLGTSNSHPARDWQVGFCPRRKISGSCSSGKEDFLTWKMLVLGKCLFSPTATKCSVVLCAYYLTAAKHQRCWCVPHRSLTERSWDSPSARHSCRSTSAGHRPQKSITQCGCKAELYMAEGQSQGHLWLPFGAAKFLFFFFLNILSQGGAFQNEETVLRLTGLRRKFLIHDLFYWHSEIRFLQQSL